MAHPPHIADFIRSLPEKPWCSEILVAGCAQESKHQALTRRHIQLNRNSALFWLVFDIDRVGAGDAWDEASLPVPNFIAQNPANRHAHMAWRIRPEVAKHDAARFNPIRYVAAIQRGYTKRLGADPGYAGFLAKNPMNPEWRVWWSRTQPYSLGDLARPLDAVDMRYVPKVSDGQGLGRNCTLFDELRRMAYRDVRTIWKQGGGLSAFKQLLHSEAASLNATFGDPLHHSEVRGIVKSIANWVWDRFDADTYSRLQSSRGKRSACVRRGIALARQEQVRAIYLDKVLSHGAQADDFGMAKAISDKVGAGFETVRKDIRALRREGKL